MIMDTLKKTVMTAAVIVLAAVSCEKSNGTENNVPETEPPVMERPVELETAVYTAYPSGVNACVDSYLTLEFKYPMSPMPT